MALNKNYYSILGLESDASIDEINRVYNTFREINQNFEKISEAYLVLSDPERRAEYDNSLKNNEIINTQTNTAAIKPEPIPTPKAELNNEQALSDQKIRAEHDNLLKNNEASKAPAPAPEPAPAPKFEKIQVIDHSRPKDEQLVEITVPTSSPTPFSKKPSPFDR